MSKTDKPDITQVKKEELGDIFEERKQERQAEVDNVNKLGAEKRKKLKEQSQQDGNQKNNKSDDINILGQIRAT